MFKNTIWQQLQKHQEWVNNQQMRDWFKDDALRAERLSLKVDELFLDYSKNRITDETMALLIKLAESADLMNKIQQLKTGTFQNLTEQKPVLHPFLRQQQKDAYISADTFVEIQQNLEKMIEVAESIRQGKWRGINDKPITDIINIGIGGSDLGSKLVIDALTPYINSNLKFHFLSNIDDEAVYSLMKKIKLDNSLFIVTSKSFDSVETLLNAKTFKELFAPLTQEKLEKHFIAVTANPEKAIAFDIPKQNIFHIPTWVNGRFSLWSSVGLAIAIGLGKDNFTELLNGAAQMDQHFFTAPLDKNMPVIMALLSIWYVNFFGAQTLAVIPYDHLLRFLPAYLQQAHMESCGKSVNSQNETVDYSTSPIIWGALGCDGQHSFHQLFHQGTELVPIDFIISLRNEHDLTEHRDLLIANCLSQSQALMMGKPNETIAHKIIPGNKPSNTIMLSSLSPRSIGELLALYEHKIFVQSIIWDINAYDQWGVELGKQLSSSIVSYIKNKSSLSTFDSSTKQLLERYLTSKKK